jgi:hypothetical protein
VIACELPWLALPELCAQDALERMPEGQMWSGRAEVVL